ncbi:MAG: AAA family ATPase [Chloroflexi bacterium]|nr:AAA family ATPase [Chloroflexota bacterium]
MEIDSQQIRVLALVGMPGAGKTLCAKHLEKRGFYQFRFGSIVVDEVHQRGLPLTPENERLVREEFRHNEGMDVMAKRALPYLRAALQTRPQIVIDGLYSFSEYRTLHAEFEGRMVVVAIISARSLRYARLAQRPERPLNAREAEERDFQEIDKLEKGGPIAIADYTLLNNGTAQQLLAELDALLETLHFYPLLTRPTIQLP